MNRDVCSSTYDVDKWMWVDVAKDTVKILGTQKQWYV